MLITLLGTEKKLDTVTREPFRRTLMLSIGSEFQTISSKYVHGSLVTVALAIEMVISNHTAIGSGAETTAILCKHNTKEEVTFIVHVHVIVKTVSHDLALSSINIH